MAKLPPPTRPLPELRRGEVKALRSGSRLYRIYNAGGRHATSWNALRTFGPTAGGRFDPHVPPPRDQDRGVLYAAGSIATAVAEKFGSTRVIELRRDDPWLVAFTLSRPVRLLDLSSAWPTRAGSSQAIASGRKDVTRLWARAIHEDYDVDGVWYPSSMSGTVRAPGDPVWHGLAAAIFERAADALPRHPALHLPLDHPGLAEALAAIAERFGYGLIA